MKLFIFAALMASAPQSEGSRIFHRDPLTNWITWSEKDAVTDKLNSEIRLPSLDKKANLVLSCSNRLDYSSVDMWIEVPFYAGSSLTEVITRVDTQQPTSYLWTARDRMVIHQMPGDLLNGIVAGKTVLFRIYDSARSPHDFFFNPGGGETLVQSVYDTCHRRWTRPKIKR